MRLLPDAILVTKLQTVTAADVQAEDEDDGAGIGGRVNMGHFPVGTARARFALGWISVVSGAGRPLIVEDQTARVGGSGSGGSGRYSPRYKSVDSFFESDDSGNRPLSSSSSMTSLASLSETSRSAASSSAGKSSMRRGGKGSKQGGGGGGGGNGH
eukprot:SAG22_NODE_2863_length_2147_cov_1.537109_3_plen_155_part_01